MQDGFYGGIFAFPGGAAGSATGLPGCVEARVVFVVELEGCLASGDVAHGRCGCSAGLRGWKGVECCFGCHGIRGWIGSPGHENRSKVEEG